MALVTSRLLTDDLLPDLPVQTSHPMDSSRVLLGLMTLSRKAAASEGDRHENEALEGVISAAVLRSLLSALHFRDVTTVRHARRVALMAVGIAQQLGWEGRHLKLLEIAALLHDIGKIGVPDNILFKPGRLGPDEADLMSLHHNIGVDVLQACRVDKEVLEIVGQARDYYNGATSGFRRNGNTVHMGARILSVADAYDSLHSDQVYRKGKSHEEIMKILMENAGTQFDGNIVCTLSRWSQSVDVAGGPLGGSGQPDMANPVCAPGPAHPEEALEASTLCHIFSYLYLLESLYDGFYLVDSDLRFTVWNGGAERLLGHRTQDMQGNVWTSRTLCYADEAGNPLPDKECPMHAVVESGRAIISNLKIRHADGQWIDVETQTVPLLDEHGRLQGVAEIFRDTARTNRKPQEYRDLRMAASRDALTSVANRGELETQLALLLSESVKSNWNEPFSIMFLDVDHFKKINDRYGHGVGDTVLIEVARLLQHETYSGELVGRYGGEEFVILCPATGLEQAIKRAERVRCAISRKAFDEMDGRAITASFGVTQAEPGDSVESVLRRADKALYTAKHDGRNLTRSLTIAEMMQPSADAEQADPSPQFMVHQGSFFACIAAEMIVYKLGGFVNDEGAKLLEVTPNRAVLRLGSRGLLPFWGSSEDRKPVDIEVNFNDEIPGPESRDRRRNSSQVLVTVRIRPVGWIRNKDVFEARAKSVLKQLCSYFAAELRNSR